MTYTTEHPTADDLVNPHYVPTLRRDRRVYKYPVPIDDTFIINMPEGAQILDVQVQGPERLGYAAQVMMWVLVDTERPIVQRQFRMAGTGQPVTGRVHHISTIQLQNGALVLHLFEVDPPYPDAHLADVST